MYSASTRSVSKALRYIARTVEGYHGFTCTPCVSSASVMSHTCLGFPSRSWYSFTDLGGTQGRVDLCADIRTCHLPVANRALYHTAASLVFYVSQAISLKFFSANPSTVLSTVPADRTRTCSNNTSTAGSLLKRWLQLDSTWIHRPFDCLSKVVKVTAT